MGLRSIRFIGLKVFFSHNKTFLALCGVSIISVVLGIFCCIQNGVNYTVFDGVSDNFTYYFLRIFLLLFAFLAMNVLSSLFLLGPATVVLATALYGFGMGYSACSTISAFGYKGLLVNAVCIVLPFTLVFVITMIFAAKSVRLTFLMGSRLSGKASGIFYNDELKRYLLLALIMVVIYVSVALVMAFLITFLRI